MKLEKDNKAKSQKDVFASCVAAQFDACQSGVQNATSMREISGGGHFSNNLTRLGASGSEG
jgi:hypothetical protein